MAAARAAHAASATSDDAQAPFSAQRFLAHRSLSTSVVSGMNDGVIFPPPFGEQPDPAPSARVNQALDRSPLRGDIKYDQLFVSSSEEHESG